MQKKRKDSTSLKQHQNFKLNQQKKESLPATDGSQSRTRPSKAEKCFACRHFALQPAQHDQSAAVLSPADKK